MKTKMAGAATMLRAPLGAKGLVESRIPIPSSTRKRPLLGWVTGMLLPLALALAYPTLAEDFTYTTNAGAVTITGYTGPGGIVSITDTIGGLPVTAIADSAFFQLTELTGVTIPTTVTNIGDYAFDGCTSLTTVAVPYSVTSIGIGAFANCLSLAAINVDLDNLFYASVDGVLFDVTQDTLIQYPPAKPGPYQVPAGVTNIVSTALASCTNLTSITVGQPNSFYTSINGVLFSLDQRTLIQYPAGRAGSYTVPNSVTSIGDQAFESCAGLTGISIPVTVTNMGEAAFAGCTSLSMVGLPGRITSIGISMFAGCTSLTNITIPNSVITLGSIAFEGCTSLVTVSIPHSVATIGDYTFEGCTSLPSIAIPFTVSTIGSFAFSQCSSLKAINVDPSNLWFSSLNGVLFDKIAATLLQYPGGGTGAYSIPATVNSIADFAFYNCAGVTSITVPFSVATIGKSAFTGCTALTAIIVDLFNVTYSSQDGILFDKSVATLIQYPPGRGGSYVVPGTVTGIGNNAFADCYNLTGVYFQGNSPTPGSSIFNGDDNTTAYYLPGTIGWGSTYGGVPALLWNPQVKTTPPAPSFGVGVNGFGFLITGSSNLVVVVEATCTLTNPNWSPVSTNTLTGGSAYFSDPQWNQYSSRFYRIRGF